MNTSHLMAIYALGTHYHSGLNSRGYRLACRAARLLNRIETKDWLAEAERLIKRDAPISASSRCDVARIYWDLVDLYSDSI